MRRIGVTVLLVGLLWGTAGAAPAPPGRTEAVLELNAAIEDERRALALLRKTPPRLKTAYSRLSSAQARLRRVLEFASTAALPKQVEDDLTDAGWQDGGAQIAILDVLREFADDAKPAEAFLEEALRRKARALPLLRTAAAPTGTPECADGKDNDRDGIVDWKLESGCTSARDVREQSPFSCDVQSRIESGRLAVSGSCSGAFSEVEFTLLGDVRLNGPYDVMHAPACGAQRTTGVRCTTKDGAKNPKHLVDARFTTTSNDPLQRVQLRFFDIRKRQIGRFVVPPLR